MILGVILKKKRIEEYIFNVLYYDPVRLMTLWDDHWRYSLFDRHNTTLRVTSDVIQLVDMPDIS